MTAYDQAAAWIAWQPAAVSGSGGHDQTFAVACALVNGFGLPRADAARLLSEYSSRCSPPWSERDQAHKLADAERARDKPPGYMLRGHRGAAHHAKPLQPMKQRPKAISAEPPKLPDADAADLPEPVPDGARALLRAAFHPGEGVRICPATLNDDGREVPDGAGMVLSREEWLSKLDAKRGDPNGIFSSTKRTGIYISVNPMRQGGGRDADVTAFRHALIEFDNISQAEQHRLYLASRLPITAIIDSGGRSVHAWVKVDAMTRQEYDERVQYLYQWFAGRGLDVDGKNKNPSRFSRLPACVRFDRRQELLATGLGAESWSSWAAAAEVEGIGTMMDLDTLADFDPAADSNCLLGRRWLCRGGGLLLVGQSGIGKSSLAVQMAMLWALGMPAFGIAPAGPLKSLFVQAENDTGDLAEMFQGVAGGLGITQFGEQFDALKQHLVFVRDTTHTGLAFTQAVHRLIDHHRPALVWLDPLLSFIGADISKQEVCGQFLRNWLNPIADATGVAWIAVHHTGKPATDPKARKDWGRADQSYLGIGSSELTNWARAVATLSAAGDHGLFRLTLAKRGKRAGATHPDDTPTDLVWLHHGQDSIRWYHVPPPTEAPNDKNTKHAGAPKKWEKVVSLNTHEFLAACPPEGESSRACARRLELWLRQRGEECPSDRTIRDQCIPAMVRAGKLKVDGNGTVFKGGNA